MRTPSHLPTIAAMSSPDDRKYTESHEWVRLEGETATLGITPFAVSELTDITYVEMQPEGTEIKSGDSVGEVESVKATSDIYSPVGGEITEVNEALTDDPAKLNEDALGEGWLIKMKVADPSELEALMDASEYDKKYGD